jgi:predicted MFS family arabinose efflux permease
MAADGRGSHPDPGADLALFLRIRWPRPLPTPALRADRFTAEAWRLIGCYGIFGFGYIIPATFLPALARRQIADPAVFGWAWPLFGLAAAASTLVASLMMRKVEPRRVLAIGQVVMAAGVVAPVIAANAGTLAVAAIAIGGTFMVLTMAGMQEARRTAGNAAPRLIAAMTTSFAIGQLLGPIAVAVLSSSARALYVPSIAAALLLIASALILTVSCRPRDALSNI